MVEEKDQAPTLDESWLDNSKPKLRRLEHQRDARLQPTVMSEPTGYSPSERLDQKGTVRERRVQIQESENSEKSKYSRTSNTRGYIRADRSHRGFAKCRRISEQRC